MLGLAGILSARPNHARPLILVGPPEAQAWLHEVNQQHSSSNKYHFVLLDQFTGSSTAFNGQSPQGRAGGKVLRQMPHGRGMSAVGQMPHNQQTAAVLSQQGRHQQHQQHQQLAECLQLEHSNYACQPHMAHAMQQPWDQPSSLNYGYVASSAASVHTAAQQWQRSLAGAAPLPHVQQQHQLHQQPNYQPHAAYQYHQQQQQQHMQLQWQQQHMQLPRQQQQPLWLNAPHVQQCLAEHHPADVVMSQLGFTSWQSVAVDHCHGAYGVILTHTQVRTR